MQMTENLLPEQTLAKLGIELPPAPGLGGNYVATKQVGAVLYLSGVVSMGPDGFITGTAGLDRTVEEGYDASRQMYTMSTEEVLEHLEAILAEARQTHSIPVLPILDGITQSTSFVPTPSRE